MQEQKGSFEELRKKLLEKLKEQDFSPITIVKLRIKDIQNEADLDIIQEKTGNTLHLPLIKEVKSAIEDYLSVRPAA